MGLRALPGIQNSLTALSDKGSAESAAAGAGAGLGTTEMLRQQVRAGSGKASSDMGTGPARSTETEAVTVAAGQAAAEQVRQQAGQAAAGVARAQTELELSTRRDMEGLSEQQANQVQDYRQKSLRILQTVNQGRDKLSVSKQKAAAEQAGFLMRQSSKAYVDQLQLEGKRNRLDSRAGFQSALMDTFFKDQEDLLRGDLSFRRALAGDAREFTKYLAGMDLDAALALATGELQTKSTAAMYSSVSAGVGAGASAYSKGLGQPKDVADPGQAPPAGESDLASDVPGDTGSMDEDLTGGRESGSY